MFKTELLDEKAVKVIPLGEMQPYQIGKIVNGPHYKGCLVMRTASDEYFEVMLLTGDTDKGSCWTNTGTSHMVQLLPKGSQLLITITK